jgi:glutathione S-transferase
MKLYTFDVAPNPRRVNLFLAYKGITLSTEQINLRAGAQFTAEFRAINPQCTVPVLQLDDGSVLCEVIEICWYLEQLHPQRPLFGTDAIAQARVLGWDHYIYMNGLIAVAEVLRNTSKAFKDRAVPGPDSLLQLPELEARGRQRLQWFWQRLEQRLASSPFLAGNDFSFADIDALAVVDFAGWVKEQVPENCARLRDWAARVKLTLKLD